MFDVGAYTCIILIRIFLPLILTITTLSEILQKPLTDLADSTLNLKYDLFLKIHNRILNI